MESSKPEPNFIPLRVEPVPETPTLAYADPYTNQDRDASDIQINNDGNGIHIAMDTDLNEVSVRIRDGAVTYTTRPLFRLRTHMIAINDRMRFYQSTIGKKRHTVVQRVYLYHSITRSKIPIFHWLPEINARRIVEIMNQALDAQRAYQDTFFASIPRIDAEGKE